MLKRLGIILSIAILFLLLPFSFTSKLRDGATSLVKPLGTKLVRQNATVSNFLHSIRQIPDLRQDKSRLEGRVIELQQSVADKEAIARENEALRKELGVSGSTKTLNKIFTHVVLGPESGALDRVFIIDAGSSQGIKVGQAAVTGGALIGRVITVREHSAVVRSILSSESRIQVWTVSNREKGLLVGNGNQVYLEDITQGVEIKEGEVVETSGLGGSLPQGILLGEVESRHSAQSELSQSFAIRLAQDPSQIDSLFVILTDTQ